ncbi:MAG: kelch repeat-containing protein [candidate division WOR-3 bacterium]
MNVSKIIIDSVNQRAILFGGGFGGNYWSDGVYEMSLLDTMYFGWRQTNVSGPHHKRGYHTFTYDTKLKRGLVFGGDTTDSYPNYNNDVWALDLTVGNEHWTRIYPSGYPIPARCASAYGYDANRNKLYVFGGWDFSQGQIFNDVYELNISTMVWTKFNPTGITPARRRNAAGVFDIFNNNFIVFDGDNYSSMTSETDILFLGSTHPEIGEWMATKEIDRPDISVSSPSVGNVRIRYILPVLSSIKVDIVDMNGRIVKTLYSGTV